MTVSVRVATDDDFRAFFAKEPPPVWTAMAGIRDGELIGIGGVVYSEEGIAVGFLDARERPSVTLHKTAIRFLRAMQAVGEPVIYAACDRNIPRAEEWLARMGFKLLPERHDNSELWRWKPMAQVK